MNVHPVFDSLPLPAMVIEPDRTLRSFNRQMLAHVGRHGGEELLRGTVGGTSWISLSALLTLNSFQRTWMRYS